MKGTRITDSRLGDVWVESDQDTEKRRPQFTIRTVLLVMLIVALAFGWYKSVVEAEKKNEVLSRRLLDA